MIDANLWQFKTNRQSQLSLLSDGEDIAWEETRRNEFHLGLENHHVFRPDLKPGIESPPGVVFFRSGDKSENPHAQK